MTWEDSKGKSIQSIRSNFHTVEPEICLYHVLVCALEVPLLQVTRDSTPCPGSWVELKHTTDLLFQNTLYHLIECLRIIYRVLSKCILLAHVPKIVAYLVTQIEM